MKKYHGQIVNLFAQSDFMEDAVIIGNKVGLLELRKAIDEAIENKKACCSLMASDLGTYECTIIMNDEDLEQPFWENMKTPYAELIDNQPNAFHPDAYSIYGLSGSDNIPEVIKAIERDKKLGEEWTKKGREIIRRNMKK